MSANEMLVIAFIMAVARLSSSAPTLESIPEQNSVTAVAVASRKLRRWQKVLMVESLYCLRLLANCSSLEMVRCRLTHWSAGDIESAASPAGASLEALGPRQLNRWWHQTDDRELSKAVRPHLLQVN
eukprot:843947-Pleurochrysis_carterae.AAC.1